MQSSILLSLFALAPLALAGCGGGSVNPATGTGGGGGGTGGSATGGAGGSTSSQTTASNAGGGTTSSQTGTGGAPLGKPIETPKEQWTWVPFDDAFCANGSTTGIGANISDKSNRVVIYLMGGGACWDNLTCYNLKTAANIDSGYAETQFQGDAKGFLSTSMFDRNNPSNPLKDASFFFVPYCTGDVHAGDNPNAVYGNKPTKQVGFANMKTYLSRIVATFPNAERVILSGSSAGGFGAGLNWWQTQQAFGNVRVDLLDDSGPPLPSPYLSQSLQGQWRSAWNLNATLPAGCTECQDDLSAIFAFYAQNLPKNRAALLSYDHDDVISGYFLISQAKFAEGLSVLGKELDGYDNARYFFVAGDKHVLLFEPTKVSQNGVVLQDWLTQFLTDDPNLKNVKP